VQLSKFLIDRNVTVLSTGGTYQKLKESFDSPLIVEVSDVTGFPEILGGRVKTLHPSVHAGILAKRADPVHKLDMERTGLGYIDMVVSNLYPFKQTLESGNEELIIENIDIGGHSLVRAAAKNFNDVLVVTDPNDYQMIIDSWDKIDVEFRREQAAKAYSYIAHYDMLVAGYFNKDHVYRSYEKERSLKYGTNPQQKFAGMYRNVDNDFPFEVVNGNPGYINMLDAVYSWNLVSELERATGLPAVASFKHNSPAGVAVSGEMSEMDRMVCFVPLDKQLTPVATAFIRARNADPMCSFGDFIAVSGIVDECTANLIKTEVSDGIVAAGYTKEALDILMTKKNGSYIVLIGKAMKSGSSLEVREMHGLVLIQEENTKMTNMSSFNNIVCGKIPDKNKMDLIIGNSTLKYTQSNSVCAVKDGQVIGVGAGQQSRVDCVKLVKRKAISWFLRRHPKVLKLHELFVKGIKRTDKVNAIVQYIENDMADETVKLFDVMPDRLTDDDKTKYINGLNGVSLASDAMFPFTDNIYVAKQFGTEFIIQPGGSIADDDIVKVCNELGISMAITGPEMRMFLH
jgi:phosphoribosylaminoimidazolecarboxamide formyltransferase/IMP cyclohydrolase